MMRGARVCLPPHPGRYSRFTVFTALQEVEVAVALRIYLIITKLVSGGGGGGAVLPPHTRGTSGARLKPLF